MRQQNASPEAGPSTPLGDLRETGGGPPCGTDLSLGKGPRERGESPLPCFVLPIPPNYVVYLRCTKVALLID